MNIIYNNSTLKFDSFWEWVGNYSRTFDHSRDISGLLANLSQNPEEVSLGGFQSLLGLLLSVRQGHLNPIGLRIFLKRRVYLVKPNGDLFLERDSRVKLRSISLDEMITRLGKG